MAWPMRKAPSGNMTKRANRPIAMTKIATSTSTSVAPACVTWDRIPILSAVDRRVRSGFDRIGILSHRSCRLMVRLRRSLARIASISEVGVGVLEPGGEDGVRGCVRIVGGDDAGAQVDGDDRR